MPQTEIDVNEHVGLRPGECTIRAWQQVVGCCAESDSVNRCGSVYRHWWWNSWERGLVLPWDDDNVFPPKIKKWINLIQIIFCDTFETSMRWKKDGGWNTLVHIHLYTNTTLFFHVKDLNKIMLIKSNLKLKISDYEYSSPLKLFN